MITAIMLAAGIAMLFSGGETLVRGASGLARAMRVPPLIVGLTIVAFGTSAPELVVNVVAVLQGNPHVAFGNVVGSNMANIGLILGLAALFRPIEVDATSIVREIPMMILVSASAVIMGLDGVLSGTADSFNRTDGLVLLLMFGAFMYYNMFDAIRASRRDRYIDQVEHRLAEVKAASILHSFLLTFVGIVLLVAGGKLTVMGAVGAARALGVSEGLIGLSVVAVGTSLPELAASVVASARRESEIALGNIIGSNIFNLSFVMGVASAMSPVDIPGQGRLDLAVMMGLALVLLPMSMTTMRRITRTEGAILLVAYGVYMTIRAVWFG